MSDNVTHPGQRVVSVVGPKRVLGAAIRFARTQGTQPSTWRGLVMLISACGVALRPEVSAAIIAAGMAASGLIGVLAGPDSVPPPPAE